MSQEVSSPLTVRSIDFRKELNGKAHHTSDFLTSALAVRRGQIIKIRLQLSRDLSPEDQVVIELSVGEQCFLYSISDQHQEYCFTIWIYSFSYC